MVTITENHTINLNIVHYLIGVKAKTKTPIGRFLKNDSILTLALNQLIVLSLQFLIQAFFFLN